MAIHVLHWNEPYPAECLRGAVSVGNFDGVHRGHLSLLAELQKQARLVGGRPVAVTFDPHPLQLLRPEQFQPVLTTISGRARLLRANGADEVVILQTSWDLLRLTAAEFVNQILHARLQAQAVVEGPNFGFGRDREGNVQVLVALCQQAAIPVTVVPPLQAGGRPVSSSRVRNALVAGDMRGAAALLGRPYQLRGTVGTGQHRGHTIGFPTANLERIETLVPGNGVYAVRVHYQGTVWPGAANIGPNPTFGEQTRKIEVHLIGFQGDLVGQELAVDFLERLRDTRPFAGVEQLVEQLHRDVERAQAIVSSEQ
ncbi:MAG TPA: bifunctional riboflavin kinase/FAD synthetase [Gemmataceae bacterium]|nr:bifunctional riboflavin kinase/FAD synthetase [Gemmataceae bacterium]